MTKKDIGKVVAQKRKQKGVTIYRLMKEAGIQRNQILAIEKGDKSYTVDSLLNTCTYFGLRFSIHTD